MVNNPTGFSPAALAAMNSSAIQNTATDVQNATRAANTAAASKGGNGLPSGVQAQVAGQIASAGANQESGDLNQIQIANEQQRQANYWNAIGGLNNVAAAENPTGYAGAANSGAATVAGLSQAYSASEQASPLTSFTNSFGKGLGAGLSSFASGGLSSAFSNTDTAGGDASQAG